MNALYVTVSIPLLLVLAGFNHAHGLTTFGKSNNQGQQNGPPPPAAQAKHCTNQANCTLIKGTTCLRGYCLCGDNSHPINGGCNAIYKGPRHICSTNEECVEGAECLPPKDKSKPNNNPPSTSNNNVDKICTCVDGLESGNACGGGSNLSVLPGLILAIMALSRTLN